MGEFRVHHVRFFEYQPKAIHCISYNKDAEKLAVSRSDGTLELWSSRDHWFQEKVIPGVEGKSVEALCWQGERLFTAGLDGYITEFDLLRLQPKAIATSNAGPIWCLTSDPTGKLLAAGTEDGCVVIFDTENNSLEFKRSFDKQESRILCIAWHSAGETIVTGGIDNIRLWSVRSGHAYQRLTLGRQEKNKETIVWCLAITSDMTIVSGDSRGKTSFWNGEQGTLIKAFLSHKADVFCLCVDNSETSVLSSGVDSTVVQFEYTTTQKDSDWKLWVKSSAHFRHTHDVRSLALANNHIVSGGVDTNLIVYRLHFGKKKIWRKLNAIPHKSMVQVAKEAEMIVLKYNDYLEVWRLGHTNKTSQIDGEVLPLQSNPLKLVQLKNKSSEAIVCFAISSHGNLIAFSDQDSIRAYRLVIENKELINPSVSIQKLKMWASDDSQIPLPAHHMVVSTDGGTIVTATVCGNVQILCVENGLVKTDHTFHKSKDQVDSITMMCLCPADHLVAVGDSGRNVTIYDIIEKQVLCQLPQYSCQVTAMAFTLSGQELLTVYADQMVYEFDVAEREYSEWSKTNSTKFPYHWKKRHSKINHIFFQSQYPHKIFLHDEQTLYVLDKTKPFPIEESKMWKKGSGKQDSDKKAVDREDTDESSHPLSICKKYKFILHMDALSDDWLITVERPPAAINDNLPSTLKVKKFGT
ncbi:U3 small nucleolar RNA-associated protein 4 homolog [Ylistrum balloti]|uniref:U3 small nucleolar RNA-associated protein 4 homolog n=1 Tax=Ylistrum balloti TaxID=509963 RepID=UPI0029058F48|nr:U3 small nucleolar RNA-associated protein 4 homolog [Ylistrum balloti]